MKIAELFESRSTPLTQSEFDALPSVDTKNIIDRYRVGKVAFDNENGMGSVPYNQEVNYFGFVVNLTPDEYLKLAPPGDREQDAKSIVELIKKKIPIGAPFLRIKYNEKEFEQGNPLKVKVVGHEGRARMTAIEIVQGNSIRIPVHIIPQGEVRARHFNERFFQELRASGIVPETKNQPIHVSLGKIFWMGKTL